MVKRKLDGAVDRSSADQKICIIWRPAPSGTWSYGRLADKIWVRLEILKLAVDRNIRLSALFS